MKIHERLWTFFHLKGFMSSHISTNDQNFHNIIDNKNEERI